MPSQKQKSKKGTKQPKNCNNPSKSRLTNGHDNQSHISHLTNGHSNEPSSSSLTNGYNSQPSTSHLTNGHSDSDMSLFNKKHLSYSKVTNGCISDNRPLLNDKIEGQMNGDAFNDMDVNKTSAVPNGSANETNHHSSNCTSKSCSLSVETDSLNKTDTISLVNNVNGQLSNVSLKDNSYTKCDISNHIVCDSEPHFSSMTKNEEENKTLHVKKSSLSNNEDVRQLGNLTSNSKEKLKIEDNKQHHSSTENDCSKSAEDENSRIVNDSTFTESYCCEVVDPTFTERCNFPCPESEYQLEAPSFVYNYQTPVDEYLVDSNSLTENNICEGRSLEKVNTPNGFSNGTLETDPAQEVIYLFKIESKHAARLIGKNGYFIKDLTDRADVGIAILGKKSDIVQLCSIKGFSTNIEKALELINRRFPVDSYPSFSTEQFVPFPNYHRFELNGTNKLSLPNFTAFHILVQYPISPNHFFIQQSTHPTFYGLETLQWQMNQYYNSIPNDGLLEHPEKGFICIVGTATGWCRALIEEVYQDECSVQLLDCGGYHTVPISSLRQICAQFLDLPFQAIECFLNGIMPADEKDWSDEALSRFKELCMPPLLGRVVGQKDGLPVIKITKYIGEVSFDIGDQLIEENFAKACN